MRIDDVNRSPQPAPAAKTNSQPADRAQGDEDQGVGTDSTEISSVAKALQIADPQRLEKLRLDVLRGHYQVSADKVAQAIVDDSIQD